MPTQSIDLASAVVATFNGSALDQINLNGASIWTKPIASPTGTLLWRMTHATSGQMGWGLETFVWNNYVGVTENTINSNQGAVHFYNYTTGALIRTVAGDALLNGSGGWWGRVAGVDEATGVVFIYGGGHMTAINIATGVKIWHQQYTPLNVLRTMNCNVTDDYVAVFTTNYANAKYNYCDFMHKSTGLLSHSVFLGLPANPTTTNANYVLRSAVSNDATKIMIMYYMSTGNAVTGRRKVKFFNNGTVVADIPSTVPQAMWGNSPSWNEKHQFFAFGGQLTSISINGNTGSHIRTLPVNTWNGGVVIYDCQIKTDNDHILISGFNGPSEKVFFYNYATNILEKTFNPPSSGNRYGIALAINGDKMAIASNDTTNVYDSNGLDVFN
jgi:hypothetical protein